MTTEPISLRRFIKFWSQEHSLTALLIILIVELFFLSPMTGVGRFVSIGADFCFFFILYEALQSMVRRRAVRLFFTAFVFLAIVVRVALILTDLRSLQAWDFICSSLAILGMLIVTSQMVYRDGPVTSHRIRGAIAAYLLLAMVFAKIYNLTYYLVPGSFSIAPALVASQGEYMVNFQYFSIVTLTTVGFGDITPVAPFIRSFVMAEALIGQLYPAILIARLVSLGLLEKSRK